METVRRYEFSLLLLLVLLLAAVSGLAFIFGLFRDLVDSSDSAGLLGVVAGAGGDSPLTRPGFLTLVFFLSVLIIFFLLSQSRKLYWLAAALFILLLLLIGTPLAEGTGSSDLDIGELVLLENGLNVQLDQGGVVASLNGLGQTQGGTSGEPTPGIALSPEGGRVLSDIEVFRVRGARHTSYLRVVAATDYNGEVWTVSDDLDFVGLDSSSFEALSAVAPQDDDFSQRVEDNITLIPMTSFGKGLIPSARNISYMDFPAPLLWNQELIAFQSLEAVHEPYRLTASHYTFPEHILESKPVGSGRRYLPLPDTIPNRVRQLALDVTREAGAESPYAKAKALERHLKTNYTYDLNYTSAPSGWESSDWFLFEDRRGVCANFNHAFVVMARSLGLPARPVTGWAIAPLAEEQTVRAKQAHMWAEVLFEELGWVRFDATGAGGAPDRVQEEFGVEPPDVPTPTSAPTTPGSTPEAPEATPTPADTPTPPERGELLENGMEESGVEAPDVPTPTGDPTPLSPTTAPVSTTTEITALDPTATKGDQFTVAGVVEDHQGRPVDSMAVEIFINETKEHGGILLGTGETNNGEFRIVVQVPKDIQVGEYQVMAHALPFGNYQDSWSDPPIIIRSETETTLEGPDTLVDGIAGTFTGSVGEVSGEPLDGHEVQMLVEGVIAATIHTSSEGEFSFEHTFQEEGPYTVQAEFTGDDFLLPSNAEKTIQVFAGTIKTDVPDTLVRGETTPVGGSLILGASPLSGEAVEILWDGRQIAEVSSQDDGTFSYDLSVDPSESLETHRLTVSVAEIQEEVELEVAVKARTSLLIAGPQEGRPEDALAFDVTLLDDFDFPIPRAPVSLDEHAISGITDEEGIANLFYQIPQEVETGPQFFSFRFEETDQYLASEASREVSFGLPPSRLWIWLTAALAPVALLTLGGGFYFYRRRSRMAPSLDPAAPPLAVLEEASPPAGRRRLATAVYIELPQIVPLLPAVWGVGEPLAIRITLRDENQTAVSGHIVEVSLEDESIGLATDSEGVSTLEHTFSSKGAFTVAATIHDSNEYSGTSRQVSVRVVDYREEVVRLYNDSLQELRRNGLPLSPESTPREVEDLVRQKWDGGSEAHVGQMVDRFEEADYSLHEVHRDQYVRMYLSCSQLRQRIEASNAVTA